MFWLKLIWEYHGCIVYTSEIKSSPVISELNAGTMVPLPWLKKFMICLPKTNRIITRAQVSVVDRIFSLHKYKKFEDQICEWKLTSDRINHFPSSILRNRDALSPLGAVIQDEEACFLAGFAKHKYQHKSVCLPDLEVIHDIFALCREVGLLNFSFIRRSGNRVAYELLKMGSFVEDIDVSFEEPPL
ncbi:hypothetical protein F0562_018748 [Nyssa sinensis]|uniref:RNase H type-1 domain-containing protein n=1 Tax=Nyssa sinensis TaxID=561372 RepID=A0A5J4ZEA7_9ASTE|nr:hypothetical protein F0562_018748 [Nyssa sinensis]